MAATFLNVCWTARHGVSPRTSVLKDRERKREVRGTRKEKSMGSCFMQRRKKERKKRNRDTLQRIQTKTDLKRK